MTISPETTALLVTGGRRALAEGLASMNDGNDPRGRALESLVAVGLRIVLGDEGAAALTVEDDNAINMFAMAFLSGTIIAASAARAHLEKYGDL